jgi:flagellar hook protein FlgE
MTNGTLGANGALTPIAIEKGGSLAPQATENMSMAANLDSQADIGSEFNTSMQVFDSLGTAHQVTVKYTKNAIGQYTWTATIPAVDTGGAAADPPVQVGTGTLTFDGSGVLTGLAANPTIQLTGLSSGAVAQTITFGILDDNGTPRLTSYASPSSVSSTIQDGSAFSRLRDFSIDSDGVISGIYDNGAVHALAQLALATFPNDEGLLKFKGTTFVAYGNSGEPSIGTAGTGGRGSVSGSSLEQSNVDIATEFTNLIISQRGYQANSRIITTTDELYQEAINLIR